jgi:hypothetical protein
MSKHQLLQNVHWAAGLSALLRILIATGLAVAVMAPARAQESMARDSWRTFMTNNPAETEGCFHASYPGTTWEEVACEDVDPSDLPGHINQNGAPEVGGSGDYVAQTTQPMTLASGGFAVSSISGLISEVGVSEFHNKKGVPLGIVGPDQYAVQLNTNRHSTTAACAGHTGCQVWQQFIYASNYPTATSGGKVFMQYWLFNWGSSKCPSTSWTKSGTNCYKNSKLLSVPSLPITSLGQEGLSGTAKPGGLDAVTFVNGSDAYILTGRDSVLDISSVWKRAEFNVVGNTGGAQAQFNPGITITVTLIVADGTGTAPTCVPDDGTTGESNNLSVGPCTAADQFFPYITYTEST